MVILWQIIMMKHFNYFIVLFSVILFSCSDKYVIKGTSSQTILDGKVAYIKHANNGEFELIDSCKVLHGKFEMTGLVDSIMCVSLFMGEHNCIPIVLEYGDINISFIDSSIKVEGTPLNDKLYSFLASRDSLMLQLAELPSIRNMMIFDGYDMREVSEEIRRSEHELLRAMQSLEKKFVMDNFDNVLGITWFMELCNDATIRNGYPSTTPMIEEIYISAPDDFRSHPTISSFMQKVDDAMFGNMPQKESYDNAAPARRQSVPNVHDANF